MLATMSPPVLKIFRYFTLNIFSEHSTFLCLPQEQPHPSRSQHRWLFQFLSPFNHSDEILEGVFLQLSELTFGGLKPCCASMAFLLQFSKLNPAGGASIGISVAIVGVFCNFDTKIIHSRGLMDRLQTRKYFKTSSVLSTGGRAQSLPLLWSLTH